MGPDPHVVGIIPRDCSQYRGPLHAIPDHDQGEHPRYAHDDLWCFKYSTDEADSSCLFFHYLEDMCKLEECMWEVGQLKDMSAHRLEGLMHCI